MQTAALALPIPGIFWGDYPERAEPLDPAAPVRRRVNAGRLPGNAVWQRRVAGIRARVQVLQGLGDAAFRALLPDLQARLAHDRLAPAAVDAACAHVVEAARRALDRVAFDGQVVAALCMMDNCLVEMATGEGKSLATALAAAIAALGGIPVHVITANDYLVARDAHSFQPLFELLGLEAAAVVSGQETELRQAAYQHPIVYATARELAFDYLRDRLRHGSGPALVRRLRMQAQPARNRPLLRGLCMAIIDEADSVLIDDAQMPLVLSREVRDPTAYAFLWQAWMLSERFTAGLHFLELPAAQRVVLTDAGRQELARLAERLPPVWKNTLHREDTVQSALAMRHCLRRDRDYLVIAPAGAQPARIALIDSVTGRIAEGRKWSAGLHALAALKEGLQPEGELQTLASITFQRFFRRYHRLGGMSGTLVEVRRELRRMYGLEIVKLPARRPLRRVRWPTLAFEDDARRWESAARRVAALSAQGRPVLVGTDSVEASQRLSACLRAAGIAHTVLNARHDAEEAAIVAQAGQAGRVTVSTNMAGRGTDILLTPQALAAGGLHVLCCQRNLSRRHDRQLAGRAGRQGEPGSVETWLSPLPSTGAQRGRLAAGLTALRQRSLPRCASTLLDVMLWLLQYNHEMRRSHQRQVLFQRDCELEQSLSFCGANGC